MALQALAATAQSIETLKDSLRRREALKKLREEESALLILNQTLKRSLKKPRVA